LQRRHPLPQGSARSPALSRAISALQSGDPGAAARIAERHVTSHPRDPEGLRLFGSALIQLGETRDARTCLERAIALDPSDPRAPFDLANAMRIDGEPEAAVKVLEEGLRRSPHCPPIVASLCYTLTLLARHQDALELAERELKAAPGHPALLKAKAMALGKLGRPREAAALLRTALEHPRLPRGLVMEMNYLLAEQLDRLAEHDAAFHAAQKANRLHPSVFDAAAHREGVDEAIANWTREEVERLRAGGIEDDRPLLIVGMPRSGTTLVERILGAHPDVCPLGERPEIIQIAGAVRSSPDPSTTLIRDPSGIDPADLRPRARRCMETFASLAGDARRVTDKTPLNALHLGLVAAMLPNARVVHCVRDPEDTAISIFLTFFMGHLPFASGLAETGCFHADLDRLMAHWKTTLDIPIHEVSYEALVRETEPTVRSLLDFAGLDWDERCLRHHEHVGFVATASHDQVRKPVYTSSVGRAKAYAKHMQPFRDAYRAGLAPA